MVRGCHSRDRFIHGGEPQTRRWSNWKERFVRLPYQISVEMVTGAVRVPKWGDSIQPYLVGIV